MKHRYVVAAVVLALVGAAVWYLDRAKGDTPVYESVRVTRASVENIVSVTGHVEPLERLTLAFTTGGRIARVLVKDGDRVEAGDTIATLELGDLEAVYREAVARLERERAVLANLLLPLRSEERSVEEATVAQALQALESARAAGRVTIGKAFVLADDAVHEEVDELFEGGAGASPSFGVSFRSGSTRYLIQGDRDTELQLNEARADVAERLRAIEGRIRDAGDVRDDLAQSGGDLLVIAEFIDLVARTVNRYVPDDTTDQTVYEAYQTSVASARSSLSTARSEVDAALAAYDAAVSSLATKERTFALRTAGAGSGELAIQRTAVRVAQEAASVARERLDDAVLRSPINGTVTRLDLSEGELVAANAPFAEVLTEGAYDIETYIPEADIARVKLGDKADVTFDAFSRSNLWHAEVVRMSLAETMREGVPTYKTTLIITDGPTDLTLRPGMTADVDIGTDMRESVLAVPTRSVILEGGRSLVRVVTAPGVFEERDVTLGLRGSEGTVEVLSGLSEGEEVVLFIEE